MLKWDDYIAKLLSRESELNGISLSFGDNPQPVRIPPIIKASVLMLDKMIECQGKFNILVFPERSQSIFIFTIIKLLYNILEGKIDRTYNPDCFVPNEKLKFGNTVVKFIGTEQHKGKKYMRIQMADLTSIAPVEFFPFFQKTNTKRRLSKHAQFVAIKKDLENKIPNMDTQEKLLKLLKDYKTHMDSSIINMTPIINTNELINGCKLCGQLVKDVILFGQADYEGNIKNIGAGQHEGIPAIVLASDLYAIVAAAEKGHPFQSVIIDASNSNAISSQLDALDDLMRLDIPLTCVTDIVNSFDLQTLIDRGFNIWRWDESSITDTLYDATTLISDKKIKNCANREVEYLVTDGKEISIVIGNLSAHRRESKEQSVQMLKLFNKLYNLALVALREIVPFDDTALERANCTLDDCENVLSGEKTYLAPRIYKDYCTAIDCLKKVFTKGYVLPKHNALEERLCSEKYESICIVISERTEKEYIQKYWQKLCCRRGLNTQVCVLHPAEYYNAPYTTFSATIVVSWLKRAIMRKILYSFNTKMYRVLLYDYEKRWRNYDTAKWNAALDRSQNTRIIDGSFSTDEIQVSTSTFIGKVCEAEDNPKTDEFEEIEVILRENKYRQYVANGGQKSENETVEAIPVNYVGGYLAFYRTGHKVILATDTIVNDLDRIKTVLPNDLEVGDFVVVRESDRDLIKEMADIILESSGKSELRSLATKWKEALEIEKLFYTPEGIYQLLQKAGCTKGYQTVRGWLMDDDIIAPQSKEDLEHIAAATGNDVLKELIDQIFDAAQIVRTAHVQAGRLLSQQLRSKIVGALSEYGDIDPFNIWEPIEMQVEGIGIVNILKIIDIGPPVIVDIADTNRLIDE